MLQRLRQAGLRLKLSKCSFFQHQVKYLGHIISREGVATDPAKTQKVADWPVPTSKREVQQFLGFAGYYRQFIREFAHTARPLYRLTERTATFKWTEECADAFQALRQSLCSTPVLAYPDFTRPFILDTDASDTGIGAVLSQTSSDGNERVIAYGSRLLTKPERQYCVTRRELLAVVYFTKQYRSYLTGRKFVLRTDHGSLTWLRNFPQISSSTLLNMLSMAVTERPFEWERHLPRLCLAYNTSVHPTTGYSPFFLMFGRPVRMPINIMYGTPTPRPSSIPKYVKDLCGDLESAYERVRVCMGEQLDRQKELYDRKAHGEPFKQGDLVWLHTPVVSRGKSRKLHRPWTGPYRVVKRLSEAVYRIHHLQQRQK